MVEILNQGKRVINVDESWINESSYARKMWCPSYSNATTTMKAVTPRISLIVALDTSGAIYFSLT